MISASPYTATRATTYWTSALIKNGILKLGLSPYIQPIVIGGIIIVTVVVDVWYKGFAEKKAAAAAWKKQMQSREGEA